MSEPSSNPGDAKNANNAGGGAAEPRLADEAAAFFDLITQAIRPESTPADPTDTDARQDASPNASPDAPRGLSSEATSELAAAGVDALAAVRDLLQAGRRALVAIAEDRLAARDRAAATDGAAAEPADSAAASESEH